SGGEWGVRGFLAAYDINTGKQVWKAFSTGPDAEMLIDPAKTMTWTDGALKPVGTDSSIKTWKGDQWKNGGGTTWGWYSYDKALNLLYYGTCNPSTWNPSQRPGDNRRTSSRLRSIPRTTCSMFRPITSAWTMSRSRLTMLRDNPMSVRPSPCIHPRVKRTWATSSRGMQVPARLRRPSPKSFRFGVACW